MSSDLIYREDAKDYARHAMAKGLNVLEYLEEVPTAEFRPVVRGHFGKHTSPFTAPCSECGTSMNMHWNFCPNCGADMRQEKEEDGR